MRECLALDRDASAMADDLAALLDADSDLETINDHEGHAAVLALFDKASQRRADDLPDN